METLLDCISGTLPARKHQFTSTDVLMYIFVCALSQCYEKTSLFTASYHMYILHTHII